MTKKSRRPTSIKLSDADVERLAMRTWRLKEKGAGGLTNHGLMTRIITTWLDEQDSKDPIDDLTRRRFLRERALEEATREQTDSVLEGAGLKPRSAVETVMAAAAAARDASGILAAVKAREAGVVDAVAIARDAAIAGALPRVAEPSTTQVVMAEIIALHERCRESNTIDTFGTNTSIHPLFVRGKSPPERA